MDKVARMKPQDRTDLFRSVAEVMSVNVPIIEKDFWVCWMLKHLYTLDDLPAKLYFKGGTSLSKVFGVIQRMSEDIDLVIDRHDLGFVDEKDPARENLGTNARNRLIVELKATAAAFVEGSLSNSLQTRIQQMLGDPKQWSLEIDVSNHDNTMILFHYPTQEDPPAYLRPMVLLELGARGDTWPAVEGILQPYAADLYPNQFEHPTATVQSITAERTFWEKATLLHTLTFHEVEKVVRGKPSRHYYDLYQLAQHQLGKNALDDMQLLADVVRHKNTFYRRAADRYDLAIPGSLRLVPPAETLRALKPEYKSMAEEMIFGDAPDFDEVIQLLRDIEIKLIKQ